MILPCPCPQPDRSVCHLDPKSLRRSIQHGGSESENCLPVRQGTKNGNELLHIEMKHE